MTGLDYILIGTIVLCVMRAILHMRKNKGCCGDCKSCGQSCHKREEA